MQPTPVQDQASPTDQAMSPKKKEQLAAEVERVQQRIRSLIREANILLSLQEQSVAMLSPVCKEFVVSQLAGDLHPPQRLVLALSGLEPPRNELSSSGTSAQPSSGDSPMDLRAVRACYILPMIPIRTGDVTFPRVLVDTGSGINVMSNRIRIKLGYQRMVPQTTKLPMANNMLVWSVGVLTSVPVVVEGIRLIVSF
ncbi:hypothetical protein R1flu_008696 [Riccia fluitans]|uniref:Aspartic peptidase DDI1-type domain-containing protein n=1 Tax=Riccia fluitans TaxID=41844 RepID=A0ABD1YCQ9_9MARC